MANGTERRRTIEDEKKYRTIEEFEAMRWGLTVITAALILAVTIVITGFASYWLNLTAGYWLGISIGCVLAIWFVARSVRSFSDNPATKWMPEVFGVNVNRLKMWGPSWLPWVSPFTIGYTEMPGGIMHIDFDPEEMIPNDRIVVAIPVHLFYSIDDHNPVQVILLGGVEKAAELLRENIEKLLQQWITHPEKGPEKLDDHKMTLNRVRRMNNEAANYILEELFRDEITKIPSDVPTEALIGLFEGRQLSPREQQLIAEFNRWPQERKDETRSLIEARMADIKNLRTGQRAFQVPSTGLEVCQMIIENIEPDKSSAEAAAKVAAANFQAEINMIEARNLRQQAEEIKLVGGDMDSTEAALLLQGKVTRTTTVKELKTSPELNATINGLGAPLVAALASRLAGGKE